MTTRSVTHATFVIERTYPASPARVYSAFADPAIQSRWCQGPPECGQDEQEMDFRVGWREISRKGGVRGPTRPRVGVPSRASGSAV